MRRGEPLNSPDAFDWIIPRKLCVHAQANSAEQIRFLRTRGIGRSILFHSRQLKIKPPRSIPVREVLVRKMQPEQIDQIISLIENSIQQEKKGMSLCSESGKLLASTISACYLCKTQGMSAEKAMEIVRELRTSLSTVTFNESAIVDYHQFLSQLPAPLRESSIKPTLASQLMPRPTIETDE